jgi:mlo protein
VFNLHGSSSCKYAHLKQGKVPILSLEALHQLDIFIFSLAVTYVALSLFTCVVGVAQVLNFAALCTMTSITVFV